MLLAERDTVPVCETVERIELDTRIDAVAITLDETPALNELLEVVEAVPRGEIEKVPVPVTVFDTAEVCEGDEDDESDAIP